MSYSADRFVLLGPTGCGNCTLHKAVAVLSSPSYAALHWVAMSFVDWDEIVLATARVCAARRWQAMLVDAKALDYHNTTADEVSVLATQATPKRASICIEKYSLKPNNGIYRRSP